MDPGHKYVVWTKNSVLKKLSWLTLKLALFWILSVKKMIFKGCIIFFLRQRHYDDFLRHPANS